MKLFEIDLDQQISSPRHSNRSELRQFWIKRWPKWLDRAKQAFGDKRWQFEMTSDSWNVYVEYPAELVDPRKGELPERVMSTFISPDVIIGFIKTLDKDVSKYDEKKFAEYITTHDNFQGSMPLAEIDLDGAVETLDNNDLDAKAAFWMDRRWQNWVYSFARQHGWVVEPFSEDWVSIRHPSVITANGKQMLSKSFRMTHIIKKDDIVDFILQHEESDANLPLRFAQHLLQFGDRID